MNACEGWFDYLPFFGPTYRPSRAVAGLFTNVRSPFTDGWVGA